MPMLTGKNPLPPGKLPPDMRRKNTSFARAAGSFVPKLTAKIFEKYGFHSAELMTDWPRVAGADVAAVSEPERIRWPRVAGPVDDTEPERRKGAILVLRVEPARALEIEYRSGEIIDRINRYFGYRAIDSLKILQAPLKSRAALAPAAARVPVQVPPPPAFVAEVDRSDLKDALSALWTSISTERASKAGKS